MTNQHPKRRHEWRAVRSNAIRVKLANEYTPAGQQEPSNDNDPAISEVAAMPMMFARPMPSSDNEWSGNFSLYLGDCLEQMAKIPDHSVDLVLTDLPYGTTACPWDVVIPFDALWAQYRRILKPTGTVISTASQPFTSILIASNPKWFREALVWEKSCSTGFLQAGRRHLKKHEDIIVLSGGQIATGKQIKPETWMTYNPQGLVELAKPTQSRNGNVADAGGTLKYGRKQATVIRVPKTRRDGSPVEMFNGKVITGQGRKQTHTNYPTSVLKCGSHRKKRGEKSHPTQKPVALYEYLLRTYSNDGDTILDNVMGSGTTGVACANVGNRYFIGIERDPEFFELAKGRIEAANNIAVAPACGPEFEALAPEVKPVAPAIDDATVTRAANDNVAVTFASACSGIEGPSAAWADMNFEPVFFADIAAFPTKFLAHKFPTVPNLGDLTKIDGLAYRGQVDVLWGSTPCQAFSAAGGRKGLADDRGALTLAFVKLVNEINPTITVWENVKGVLSDKENAFGQFLGALAGEDGELQPPRGKWTNAGYVCGPTHRVAWRLFDAKHGGVPQQRRRVFLVACPVGGGDPRDLLFEGHTGGRHPAASNARGAVAPDPATAPIYFNCDSRVKISQEFAYPLKADKGSGGRAFVLDQFGHARRLTPEECERLQGFQTGWTAIPGARDSDRWAALGNGLAVPDVRWIGERIVASIEGTLALHHWPDLPAVNDNGDVRNSRAA